MPKLTKRAIDALTPTDQEFFSWDGDVKGFGVRVKPTGSKSFVLKYRIGAKSKRFTICKVGSPYTVEQARAKAGDLLRGLREGIDPAEAKAEDRAAITVADLLDAYLADGPSLKPNKKTSSWTTDGRVIARHLKPLVGRRLARELTAADVGKVQADIAAGKTAVDVKTGPRGRAIVTGGRRVAALSLAVLGAAYGFGIDTGRVKENPARGIKLLKTERRERFLSVREVAAVAEALTALQAEAELNSTMADAARLLMLTGARKTEILALEWSWVDFEMKCLRLPDSKTGAKIIPLASAALAILSERLKTRPAARGSEGKTPFVFPAARGQGYSVGLSRAWTAVKTRAQVILRKRWEEDGDDPDAAPDLSAVRIHDLRHSFASFAVADGATLFLLGKVLGHRQARTTEGYEHLSADPVRQIAERTGNRIADAMRIAGSAPR